MKGVMKMLGTMSGMVALRLRGGRAGVVRGLAGQAAGMTPAGAGSARAVTRRGSFLVIVVGTLALLAVIMVVYVSVGQSDRRTSEAVARWDRQATAPEVMAEYTAQVIADDVFDMMSYWRAGTGMQKFFQRENWDYPGAAWAMDSSLLWPLAPAQQANVVDWYGADVQGTRTLYWSPTGGKTAPTTTAGGVAYAPAFAGSDPWLAATRPVWMNSAGAARSQSLALMERDWAAISNFAPDGLFVNLFNLRNNFDAKAGMSAPGSIGATDSGTGAPAGARMSDYLSLIDDAGAPTNQLDFGVAVSAPFRSTGKTVAYLPAAWSTRQRGAFRPVKADYPKISGQYKPNVSDYPAYQWADADGDGFFDSRWFQLTDWRAGGGVISNPIAPQEILPREGDVRWFFAARAVDLSSLVNVNAATDTAARWTFASPVGLFPSDVDLRRLLSGVDLTDQYADGDPSKSGYAALKYPDEPSRAAEDYRTYTGSVNSNNSTAQKVGARAYAGMRRTLDELFAPLRGANVDRGGATGTGVQASTPFFGSAGARSDFYEFGSQVYGSAKFGQNVQFGTGGNGPGFELTPGFSSGDLLELMTFARANDPLTTSRLEQGLGGRGSTTDANYLRLSPMRDNRAMDVERTALDITSSTGYGLGDEAYYARAAQDIRQYLTTLSGARPLLNEVINIRHRENLGQRTSETAADASISADNDLRMWPFRSTRSRPIFQGPGSRPLFAPSLGPAYRAYLAALAPFASADGGWATNDNFFNRQRTLFYGYRGQELAMRIAATMTANYIDAFDEDDVPSAYTLVVTQDGMQRLTQGAGSTNMLETYPGAFAQSRDNPDDDPNDQEDDIITQRRFLLTPDSDLQTRAQSTSRLAPTGTRVAADLLNVYGVEAQPFITAVGMFTAYADAPFSAGGDAEGDPPPAPGNPFPPITIDGSFPVDLSSLHDTNNRPDFLFRVIAFQLTNPFDRAIDLSEVDGPIKGVEQAYSDGDAVMAGVDLRTEANFSYLTYGDMVFPLFRVIDKKAGVAEYPATGQARTFDGIRLAPGETVVVYAPCAPVPFLTRRIASAGKFTSDKFVSSVMFDNWLKSQLGDGKLTLDNELTPTAGANGGRIIQIPMVSKAEWNDKDSAAGVRIGFTKFAEDNQRAAHLWKAVRRTLPGTDGDAALTNTAAAQPVNVTWNDVLEDRFGLPQDLDARLASGNNPIAGTEAGPTDDPGDPNALDNTGFNITVARWAARPRHPGSLDEGQIPLFCIEPKLIYDLAAQSLGGGKNNANWNDVDGNFAGTTITPSRTDFDTPNGWKKVSEWENAVNGATLGAVADALATPAPRWTAADNPNSPAQAEQYEWPPALAGQAGRITQNPRQWGVDSQRFRSPEGSNVALTQYGVRRLRPADMMNFLAVGPYEVPMPDGSTLLNPEDPRRWTTLAEALALGFGLDERFDKTNPLKRPVEYNAGNMGDVAENGQSAFAADTVYAWVKGGTLQNGQAAADAARPVLDNGMLVLDDFVPFLDDTGGDGVYVGTTASGEVVMGNGVPAALNIADSFIAYETRYLDSTRPIFGTVNINTAPLAVLRTLPLLSPRLNADADGAVLDETKVPAPSGSAWSADTKRYPFLYGGDPQAGTKMLQHDLAATIAAYRDKMPVELRYSTRSDATALSNSLWRLATGNPKAVTFADTNGTMQPSQYNPVGANFRGRGRFITAGVQGLREELGLRSIGELMMARRVTSDRETVNASASPTRVIGAEGDYQNFAWMGYDRATGKYDVDVAPTTPGVNSSQVGLDWTAARTGKAPNLADSKDQRTNNENAKVDTLANEFDERTALLSALSNTVTVRSDMFAVWFVVAGVRRSDTEGLGAEDPLVPSIQRRYLMIVDRSNVERKGDKPRVVMFRELPM